MSGNKTEQPTPKKLKDERKKGNVPRSEDFRGSIVFIAAVIALMVCFPDISDSLKCNLVRSLTLVSSQQINAAELAVLAEASIMDGMRFIARLILPLLIAVFSVALLIQYLLVGPVWKPIKADMQKINPAKGLAGLFKGERFWDLLRYLIKLTLACTAAWVIFSPCLKLIAACPFTKVSEVYEFVYVMGRRLAVGCGLLFLTIGGADLLYQRHKYRKDLMMTREEVRKEYKEMEGDPQIKSMRQQLRFDIMTYQQEKEIRRSSVIITNPLRIAVALKYEPHFGQAPVVTAKGSHTAARKIRRIARESKIPIIRNPSLARELYSVQEGREIPEEFYEAVAEILAFVTSLSEEEKSGFGH